MRLPPELLDQIFLLACTDGGKTCCTLRASNRTFHAMVEPYRFGAVLVTSVDGVRALCRTLRNIPVKQRRIQHLHIRLELAQPVKLTPKKGRPRRLPPGAASGDEVRYELVTPRDAVEHVVPTLFRLCTSTLLTLALRTTGEPRFPYYCIFHGSSYPLMQTLIIANEKIPFSALLGPVAKCMPKLEHFYLGGCDDLEDFGAEWPAVLRDIPHIHLQGRSRRDVQLIVLRYLSDDDTLRSRKPQVVYMWPTDGDTEAWGSPLARFAVARRNCKVKLARTAEPQLFADWIGCFDESTRMIYETNGRV